MMAGGFQPGPVHVATALAEHASTWDRLVDGMAIPSPFLRSWWLSTAARGQPCLPLVFDGERLLGGLALERDSHLGVERLRTLGAGPLCPDHLDVVAAPGAESTVASALRGWLGRPGDRLIDLDGLVSDSVAAQALPGRVRRQHTATAPFMQLAGGVFEQGSPSLRRRTTRAERRMTKDAGSCSVERVEDTEAGLVLLRRLHSRRWAGASGFLEAFERFASVCQAGVDAGEVAITVLRAGDEAVAVMVSFEVAGRISYYQSGRDPERRWRGAGTLLLARVIDDAGRRGFGEADLLRGEEAYKDDFATGRRQLWRVRCATGPRAAIALGADLAAEHGRRLAGRSRRRLRGPTRPQSIPST